MCICMNISEIAISVNALDLCDSFFEEYTAQFAEIEVSVRQCTCNLLDVETIELFYIGGKRNIAQHVRINRFTHKVYDEMHREDINFTDRILTDQHDNN